jgi:hypothetical protein
MLVIVERILRKGSQRSWNCVWNIVFSHCCNIYVESVKRVPIFVSEMLQCEFCSKARHSPATCTHELRVQSDVLPDGFLQVMDLRARLLPLLKSHYLSAAYDLSRSCVYSLQIRKDIILLLSSCDDRIFVKYVLRVVINYVVSLGLKIWH